MSPDTKQQSPRVCPTCGSRLSENATRCQVCGRTFSSVDAAGPAKNIRAAKMPEITLNLPIAMGLMVIILLIGAGIVFLLLRSTGRVAEPTQTPTITLTPTLTATPTIEPTFTPLPTFTALPPVEYTVKENEYCSTIAAIFKVSVLSIVQLNNLPADCGTLYIGQKLLIPQPTPTASPQPTSTLSGAEATEAACEKYSYTVGENDTMSGIARSFNVSMDTIKEYNGLSSDIVYQGQILMIPLCKRLPTAGPTPTATLPPPYPAANLLLPINGAVFNASNTSVTLQWAAVGTLRESESYAVTIENLTEGSGLKVVEYVQDTKFIVPAAFRPTTTQPQIIRWDVVVVRQAGTAEDGSPIWEPFGTRSEQRVFSWSGTGEAPASTPTPPPTEAEGEE